MGITIEQEHRMHTEKVSSICPLCPHWISLKEQLPLENVGVLFASDDGNIDIGRYELETPVYDNEHFDAIGKSPAIVFGGGDWMAEFYAPDWSRSGWDYCEHDPRGNLYPLVKITHWMPLPENPNKKMKE
jgi:hypothetical protein